MAKVKVKGKTQERMFLNPYKRVLTDGDRIRSGLFAHYCYDLDELLIDETDIDEFTICLCGKSTDRRH